MRLAALLPGLAAAALALSAGAAIACSCFRPQSAAAHLKGADLVFKGEAVIVRTLADRQAETTFRVDEMWKGRPRATVTVRHGLDSAACGLSYARGQHALVIASQERDGLARTSLCTSPMFPEADYRRALNVPGPAPTPPAAQCNPKPAQFAAGRPYTDALGRRAQRAAGATTLRIRLPGRAYTEELRSDRLNLDLDRASRVRRVVCG